MFNLSITACSFYFNKRNEKNKYKPCDLNRPFENSVNGTVSPAEDAVGLFEYFFANHDTIMTDKEKQQTFRCDLSSIKLIETEDYKLLYIKIDSGVYGSSSDIYDGTTKRLKLKLGPDDISSRPFYVFIAIPKDSDKVIVQKGMFVFQNVGIYGIKTVTTDLMRRFFASNYGITLNCRTISPDLFIKRVIVPDNIRKITMIRNMKSSDPADRYFLGYGKEVRTICNFSFSSDKWGRIMEKIRHAANNKHALFEFEKKEYDGVKLEVNIGGRMRTIDVHNIEYLSIIEALPPEIRQADGHPDIVRLEQYIIETVNYYLEHMVLQIE